MTRESNNPEAGKVWSDELLEQVTDGIEYAFRYRQDAKAIARAALNALGGERVWCSEVSTYSPGVICWRFREDASDEEPRPALLVPLEG